MFRQSNQLILERLFQMMFLFQSRNHNTLLEFDQRIIILNVKRLSCFVLIFIIESKLS